MARSKTLLLVFSLLSGLLLMKQSLAEVTNNIPQQTFNQALHDKLPVNILKNNEIVVVNDGTVPPYIIFNEDGGVQGASIDLLNALSQVLGIKIKHEQVSGLSTLLLGIKSARYDFAIGPVGDFVDRQQHTDFIDYVQDYGALVVLKGNPSNINSFTDICGKRVAVQAGGSAEKRLNARSEACEKEAKPGVTVQSFKDQATAMLALKSDRAEAFYSGAAMAAYFISLANNDYELVSIGLKADFPYPRTFQGAVVPKDSPLGPVILAAMQELFDNGTYQKIMQKWNLSGNAIEAPGINLAK